MHAAVYNKSIESMGDGRPTTMAWSIVTSLTPGMTHVMVDNNITSQLSAKHKLVLVVVVKMISTLWGYVATRRSCRVGRA